MKLRKNSGKILWGLFFILAAVYVVVSKLWIMPEISAVSYTHLTLPTIA